MMPSHLKVETLSSSQQCCHRRPSPNPQPRRCPLTPPTPSVMPLRSSSATSALMLCDWHGNLRAFSFARLSCLSDSPTPRCSILSTICKKGCREILLLKP
ncbi:hypothetical protein RchiOBHm_Chr5g0044261 [Rosa chinensis]|uniref:Uncharacterized protein n=1 Tax=Rosa chinensis TaxID=74649 RepID=A0A2P6QDL4_ROSCH|nr:hypothetical protein RchiOBHm_Chr5g0044261 [Rosa chinensis]